MPLTENRPVEYAEVMRQGHAALEEAANLAPMPSEYNLLPKLRLWQMPAFDVCISWTYYEAHKKDLPYLVRQVTWDRPKDSLRFADPLIWVRYRAGHPATVSIRDVLLPRQNVDTRLGVIQQNILPILIEEAGIGLDGTHYGIETYNFMASIRLSWYNNGPPDWQKLIHIVNELRAMLYQRFIQE